MDAYSLEQALSGGDLQLILADGRNITTHKHQLWLASLVLRNSPDEEDQANAAGAGASRKRGRAAQEMASLAVSH